MRTHPRHFRLLLPIMLVFLIPVSLAGCPKNQDGVVFDETAIKRKNQKRKKMAKVAKSGDMMYGRVVDRNDQPMKRVTILVSPGNGELISNKWGEYEIDTLFADDGSRIALKKGEEYTINAWKPGYHETTQIFRFEGGVREIPTITLIEDTIKLDPLDMTPMIPTDDDDVGAGAVGKSVENE